MNALPKTLHSVTPDIASTADTLEGQLMQIFEAVDIISLSRFQIGNRPVVSLPAMSTTDTPRSVTTRLTEYLWPALYDAAYARPFSVEPPAARSVQPAPDLLSQLRAVFPEGSRWSNNWQIYKNDANGAAHVRKGDCCRQVMPGTFAITSAGQAQASAIASILLPTASSQQQAGFYHIHSHAPYSDHDDASLARLYLNTRPETVVSVMSQIAGLLNAYAVPFRAKTLLDPAAYDRTDSTVFYLARRHLAFTLALLRDLFPVPPAELAPDVPLFSKSLTSGIGGADDPGYGMSFGQTRAMMMADAIVSAWADGSQSPSIRIERLRKRFDESGMTLNAPHLNAGNSDIYRLPA